MMDTDEATPLQPPSNLPLPPVASPLAMPVITERNFPFVELAVGVACAWGMELIVAGIVAVVTFTSITKQGAAPAAFGPEGGVNPFLIFSLASCSGVFAAAVSWYILCRRRKKSFVEGFRLRNREPAWLGLGLIVGIVVPIAIHFIGDDETGNSMMAQFASSERGILAIAIFALIAPILEEMYYRGFIFTYLREYLGGIGAFAIVSAWFGFAHAGQLAGDWLMLLIVMAMGTFWTYLRHASGSLLPGLASHWIYNALLVGPALILR